MDLVVEEKPLGFPGAHTFLLSIYKPKYISSIFRNIIPYKYYPYLRGLIFQPPSPYFYFIKWAGTWDKLRIFFITCRFGKWKA
jgi:hypothetical protein